MGDVRIIGSFNLTYFFTWVDASYAVHPNIRIYKGGVISMVYGRINFRSSEKNLNAIFLTEA